MIKSQNKAFDHRCVSYRFSNCQSMDAARSTKHQGSLIMINPYEPSSNFGDCIPLRTTSTVGTQIMLLAVASRFGLGYVLIQSQRIPAHLAMPTWPVLVFAMVTSCGAALRCTSVYLPPTMAIACICNSLIAFAITRSWAAAELHLTIPLAIVCSIPSFLIALSRYRARFQGYDRA